MVDVEANFEGNNENIDAKMDATNQKNHKLVIGVNLLD